MARSGLPIGVAITTVGWIVVTFLTRPTTKAKLREFYALAKPGGPGWKKVLDEAAADGEALEKPGAQWTVPLGVVCMVAACVAVYSTLFATGYFLYGRWVQATVLTVIAAGSGFFVFKVFKTVASDDTVDGEDVSTAVEGAGSNE